MIKKFPEENFNILKFLIKGLILILLFFFLIYIIDKFFDIYDLKFQNPLIIRSPILIEKRIKIKPAGSKKKTTSNAQKKSTAQLPAGEKKEEILIKEYPKYLTLDSFELRKKILNYIENKLSKNEIIAFDNLIKKESGYNPIVVNEIGAGGLCQAYPYTKMNCKLSWDDWKCQVDWCLKYIENRYQNSINAWNFHLVNDWF